MILICGVLSDEVIELVCARLEDMNYDYRFFNLYDYPENVSFNYKTRSDGEVNGAFDVGGEIIPFDDITGIYIRFDDVNDEKPTELKEEYDPQIIAERNLSLSLLIDRIPCVVVNRNYPQHSNASKPYQLMLIKDVGINIPKTLVTNDPDEVMKFYDSCDGEIIFKSISGVRSIVDRLDDEYLERLPLLENCPSLFQEFIPGNNVRVHTVGDEIFATEIDSDVVDYRYAVSKDGSVNMKPHKLPAEMKERCFDISKKLGLVMAGIDLKLTPEGEWYCFEVNPSPGFIYYERFTLQPISEALANLLKSGDDKYLFRDIHPTISEI